MNEAEILEVLRSTNEHVSALFGQVITITFAMVVAVYYFLNRAGLALKVFGFLAYLIGMLMYFGLMVIESNIKQGAIEGLRALGTTLSPPSAHALAVHDSYIGLATRVLENGAWYLLWIGVLYLIFFWKKTEHEPRVR